MEKELLPSVTTSSTDDPVCFDMNPIVEKMTKPVRNAVNVSITDTIIASLQETRTTLLQLEL